MPKGSRRSGKSANRNSSAADWPISHRLSLDTNSRLLGYPDPLRDVVVNERGEQGGRAPDGLAADRGEPLRGFGLMDDAVELGAEAGYHRARGTGRCHDAEPRDRGKAGERLGNRR